MTKPVIELSGLTKFYGKTRGIEQLDLSVLPGEIFGFLGPNGAGKSTTIRLILHLLHPDSGTVNLFGKPLAKSYCHGFANIGNVPGELHLYESLSGHYYLDFMNRLAGNKKPVLRDELVQRFGLSDMILERKIKYFSRGMKQKLALIAAMQEKPKLLIMDEPSEGLDPLTRNSLYEILMRLRDEGHSVFFSSHNLSEVEKICDRVGLVRDGKLVALDHIAVMKEKMVRRMEVEFAQAIDASILEIKGVQVEEKSDTQFILYIKGDLNPVLQMLSKQRVTNLVFPEPSLEELFMGYYQ